MKTIDDLARQFVYTPDGRVDTWRILTSDAPEGDCDDFAITAAYIEAGGILALWWGILTFRLVPWFVWDPWGESHVVLWVRGKGWIDNQFPKYSRELKHKKRRPVFPTWVLYKLIRGKLKK